MKESLHNFNLEARVDELKLGVNVWLQTFQKTMIADTLQQHVL